LTPNLKRGTVLPIARNEQGNLTPAVPQAVIDFLKAVSLPGHVARGGQYTPSDVTEMAGNVGILGSVATKPAGALAWGLAREGARLPMDEASRMARAAEQGFSVPAYKGAYPYDWRTGKELDRFQSPGAPELTTYAGKDGGFAGFFSSEPKVADRFAMQATTEGAVFPVQLKFKNPAVIEMQGKHAAAAQFDRVGNPELVAQFKNALADPNIDGIVLRDTADEGTVYVPKESNQVRSRFAAFDPAKTESADLLAGIAGLPGVASFLSGLNKEPSKRGTSKVVK